MTYAQKLQDPRWQRKRLQRLEKAGWACEDCGAEDDTLHVHHNGYFKGREPWEYEDQQLTVLCRVCHEAHHDEPDSLLVECSFIGPLSTFARDTSASFLAGLNGRPMADVSDPDGYMLGQLVSVMPRAGRENRPLSYSEIESLITAAAADPIGFNEALRGFAVLTYKEPKGFTG